MGVFGTLIILVLAAVAGYFVYQEVFTGGSEGPSCTGVHQNCMKECRRTTTDQASASACQNECQRAFDACK
ncbi:MAG: hypothetical protein ACREVR_06280 [Burkholderiales bacterium]